MERTIKDFQMAIERKNITFWLNHRCGGCEYPCGYYFKRGFIEYDHGCDCTGSCNTSQRIWKDIKEQYDMQTNEDIIKEYDEFFGFNETEAIEEFQKKWDSLTKYYVFRIFVYDPNTIRYVAVREDGFELMQFISSNDNFAQNDGLIPGMEMRFLKPDEFEPDATLIDKLSNLHYSAPNYD